MYLTAARFTAARERGDRIHSRSSRSSWSTGIPANVCRPVRTRWHFILFILVNEFLPFPRCTSNVQFYVRSWNLLCNAEPRRWWLFFDLQTSRNYHRALIWTAVMTGLSHIDPVFASVASIHAVNEPLMDANLTPGYGNCKLFPISLLFFVWSISCIPPSFYSHEELCVRASCDGDLLGSSRRKFALRPVYLHRVECDGLDYDHCQSRRPFQWGSPICTGWFYAHPRKDIGGLGLGSIIISPGYPRYIQFTVDDQVSFLVDQLQTR